MKRELVRERLLKRSGAKQIIRDSLMMFRAKQGIRAFNMLREGAMALGIAAIFGAAIALALSKISDSGSFTAGSISDNIVNNGSEGILQLFVLLPTQGIILGIVVLIAIVLLIRMKGRGS